MVGDPWNLRETLFRREQPSIETTNLGEIQIFPFWMKGTADEKIS